MDEDTLGEDSSQDAELQGLTEDAVYTTMRFSRPFRSCDPHDQDIKVNLEGRKALCHKQLFLLGRRSQPQPRCPWISGASHSFRGSLPVHLSS